VFGGPPNTSGDTDWKNQTVFLATQPDGRRRVGDASTRAAIAPAITHALNNSTPWNFDFVDSAPPPEMVPAIENGGAVNPVASLTRTRRARRADRQRLRLGPIPDYAPNTEFVVIERSGASPARTRATSLTSEFQSQYRSLGSRAKIARNNITQFSLTVGLKIRGSGNVPV
jgi:hypothetical protein